MTAQKPPKGPSTAADAIVGHLLSQMKDELATIQCPSNPNQSVWGTQSEIQQREILDRLKRRIRGALDAGFTELFAEGVPAVRATVAGTNFKKKGIICSLEISDSAAHRHALADAAQAQVLVIVTPDIDAYMQSAEYVKSDTDQKELALDNSSNESPIPELNEFTDPRTKKELVKEASKLAMELGEPDVADSAADRTREQLIDYINWAEKKLDEETQATGSAKD